MRGGSSKRYYILGVRAENSFSCFEGSHAVPTCPYDRNEFEKGQSVRKWSRGNTSTSKMRMGFSAYDRNFDINAGRSASDRNLYH
jgi:hypothetical protein